MRTRNHKLRNYRKKLAGNKLLPKSLTVSHEYDGEKVYKDANGFIIRPDNCVRIGEGDDECRIIPPMVSRVTLYKEKFGHGGTAYKSRKIDRQSQYFGKMEQVILSTLTHN